VRRDQRSADCPLAEPYGVADGFLLEHDQRGRPVVPRGRHRSYARSGWLLCVTRAEQLESFALWRGAKLGQALTAESRNGMGTHAHPASTPYWTTFELPAIDMKAASVGVSTQIAAGHR
jgi:hypothetical protein